MICNSSALPTVSSSSRVQFAIAASPLQNCRCSGQIFARRGRFGSRMDRTRFGELIAWLREEEAPEFPTVVALHDEGMTDYLALITRFAAHGVIGEMDCLYSAWATDHSSGFDDDQIEALIGLVPTLALAVKCVSLARIAGTLVETYLGRDAG